jgi:hypothetical protein
MAYAPSPLVTNGLWFPGRHWINGFLGNATFNSESFDYLNARTGFFTIAYSASPAMALSMDKPVQNTDGIYFGPKSPGAGKNWLATIPNKGWFMIFRLYGPKKLFSIRLGSCRMWRK